MPRRSIPYDGETLGRALAFLREQKRLSQGDLASLVRAEKQGSTMGRAHLSKVERGHKPSAATLARILEALEVSDDALQIVMQQRPWEEADELARISHYVHARTSSFLPSDSPLALRQTALGSAGASARSPDVSTSPAGAPALSVFAAGSAKEASPSREPDDILEDVKRNWARLSKTEQITLQRMMHSFLRRKP